MYKKMIYNCAIVGAGPAGIISSIQLKRFGLSVILFEKNQVGGLLRNANRIENYLGFINGISAKELVSIFSEQLKAFGVKAIKAEVTKIKKNTLFEVHTKKGKYYVRSVLIATGTTPKRANLNGEKELIGKKVFYEIADLPLTMAKKGTTKKDIVIIGGGDVSFDYALNLYEKGHKPTIIIQNKVKCLELLKKRIEEKKIPYFEKIKPKSIQSDGHKIEVVCKEKTFKADYALIAVGREPTLPCIDASINDGLFFAGDVQNKRNRQVHIATGDGMQAAMNVANYLNADYLKNVSDKRNRK